MTLPPWWYVLLIGLLAVAAPVILRATPRGPERRLGTRLLSGLALYASGLILLFYSKLLCWTLVTAGLAVIASHGHPTRPWAAALLVAAPAVAAGIAFQTLAGPTGFYFYFAFALPALLLSALAVALARFGRWTRTPGDLAAIATVLLFAALTPASSFGFTFLRHYELFHAPVLLAGLAAVHWIGRRGAGKAERARAATLDASLGERLGAALPSSRLAPALLLLGLALGAGALAPAPLDALLGPIAWSLVATAAGTAAFLLATRRSAPWLLLAAAGAGIGAVLLGTRSGAEALQGIGGGPVPETLLFYLAGAALVALGLAAVVALAAGSERAALKRLATERDRLVRPADDVGAHPAGFVVRALDHLPGPRELDEWARTLRNASVRGLLLEVSTPLDDPLQGLPQGVERWLERQGTGVRIHLAVREGNEVFLIPHLDPEEEG